MVADPAHAYAMPQCWQVKRERYMLLIYMKWLLILWRSLSGNTTLRNVKTILTDGNNTSLPDEAADLIYALDMFHMIKDTGPFLKELNSITRKDGITHN